MAQRINQALAIIVTILGSHYLQYRGSAEDWQAVVSLLSRILPSAWLAVEPASNVAAWGGSIVFWGYLAQAAWGIYNTASTAGIQPAVELLLTHAVGMSLPYCFQTNVHWLKNCLLEKLSGTGKAAEMLKYIEPWMNALFMLGYTYYVSPAAAEKSTRADFIVDEAGNVISIEQKAPEHVRVTEQQGRNMTIAIPDLEVKHTFTQGGVAYVKFQNDLTMIYLGEGVQCMPNVSCDKKIIFITSDQTPVVYSINDDMSLTFELKEFDRSLLGFGTPEKAAGDTGMPPKPQVRLAVAEREAGIPASAEALVTPYSHENATSFVAPLSKAVDPALTVDVSQHQSDLTVPIHRAPLQPASPPEGVMPWGLTGVSAGTITAFAGWEVEAQLQKAAANRVAGGRRSSPPSDERRVELSVQDKKLHSGEQGYFPESKWQGVVRSYDVESADYTDYRYQLMAAETADDSALIVTSQHEHKMPASGLVRITDFLMAGGDIAERLASPAMGELVDALISTHRLARHDHIQFSETVVVSHWLAPQKVAALRLFSHLFLIEPAREGQSTPVCLFAYSNDLKSIQLHVGIYGLASVTPEQASESETVSVESVQPFDDTGEQPQAMSVKADHARMARDTKEYTKGALAGSGQSDQTRWVEPPTVPVEEQLSQLRNQLLGGQNTPPPALPTSALASGRVVSSQPHGKNAMLSVIEVALPGHEGRSVLVSSLEVNPLTEGVPLFSVTEVGQAIHSHPWLQATAIALDSCFKNHHKRCPLFADVIRRDASLSGIPIEFSHEVNPDTLSTWVKAGGTVTVLTGFSADNMEPPATEHSVTNACHFDPIENTVVGQCPAGKDCTIAGYAPTVFLLQDKEGLVKSIVTQKDTVVAGCRYTPSLAYAGVRDALSDDALSALNKAGGSLSHQPPSCVPGAVDTLRNGCFPLYAPFWIIYLNSSVELPPTAP